MQCNVASCICICFSKCIVVVIVCRIGSGSGSYSCPSIYLSVCLSVGLSDCLSVCRSLCLSVSVSVCLGVCLCVCLSLSLSVSVPVCLCACLSLSLSLSLSVSVCLSVCSSIRPSVRLSVCVSLCKQRTYSAWLPQFLTLATSKTQQFRETSSIFEVGNSKNEAILRDFLQISKVECRADGLVPTHSAILPRKRHAKSYEVLHLSRKIISANLKIWCSKMQPLSGYQRPDLRTSLMNMSLVLCLPREFHLSRSMSHACHRFRQCYKTCTFCSFVRTCRIPCACHAKRNLNAQKCSEPVNF